MTRKIMPDSDHAAAHIAAALLKHHQSLPVDDQSFLRVGLEKDGDCGTYWHMNGITAEIEATTKAIATDVVADAVKNGPGYYIAIIAASTGILQSIDFCVPFEIVESLPDAKAAITEAPDPA
jgi:hypothetical protein